MRNAAPSALLHISSSKREAFLYTSIAFFFSPQTRRAARNKTNIKTLQIAGGWKSPVMPLLYALEAEIANDGVIL